ncbi:MAG: hypothetical protein WBQ00_09500, partial [Terriglobales bacterium]
GCAPSFASAAEQVSSRALPGDLILTLGAGSVSQLGPAILERLEKQSLQQSLKQSLATPR